MQGAKRAPQIGLICPCVRLKRTGGPGTRKRRGYLRKRFLGVFACQHNAGETRLARLRVLRKGLKCRIRQQQRTRIAPRGEREAHVHAFCGRPCPFGPRRGALAKLYLGTLREKPALLFRKRGKALHQHRNALVRRNKLWKQCERTPGLDQPVPLEQKKVAAHPY